MILGPANHLSFGIIFHLSFGRYLVAKPANQIANENCQMPNDKLNLIRPPCVCRSCALSSEVFPSGCGSLARRLVYEISGIFSGVDRFDWGDIVRIWTGQRRRLP